MYLHALIQFVLVAAAESAVVLASAESAVVLDRMAVVQLMLLLLEVREEPKTATF